ncbi:hypothetical protein A5636_21760 [Mycobacterium asiaticum]|uniref:Uncharacterized protein n=1 Tax=Mycobacterium asiaticum TaxID=1790 RepID=A0A1A3N8E6_MYCAS|nr:hypothetical protein A5636_21760 [Mycobacterium asiaticum]
MIDKEALAKTKPGVIIVNAGRRQSRGMGRVTALREPRAPAAAVALATKTAVALVTKTAVPLVAKTAVALVAEPGGRAEPVGAPVAEPLHSTAQAASGCVGILGAGSWAPRGQMRCNRRAGGRPSEVPEVRSPTVGRSAPGAAIQYL